jgi:hypothetical protein
MYIYMYIYIYIHIFIYIYTNISGAATGFRKVEELENYSVAKTDIMKLKTGGFHTLESIAHNSMRRLAEVKGLSEQKIQKFKDIIKANELVQMGFQTAATRLTSMNEMIKISTGSSDLDNLLGGRVMFGRDVILAFLAILKRAAFSSFIHACIYIWICVHTYVYINKCTYVCLCIYRLASEGVWIGEYNYVYANIFTN